MTLFSGVYFLTGAYIAEIILQTLLLVRLIRAHDVRYRRLCVLTATSLLLLVLFLFTLIDTTRIPEWYIFKLILSEISALISICFAIVSFITLQTIMQRLKLESGVTKIAFIIFKVFIVIDALIMLTNPLHEFAFVMRPLPLGDVTVILFPQLRQWGHIHCYVLLLQTLTMAVALFYQGVSQSFLYGIKYLLFCGCVGATYIICILYTYISDAFQLHFALVVLVPFSPFFLYLIVYHNRPFLMTAYIRQMAVEKLGSPFVLFDVDNLLVDYNKDAADLFALDYALINRMTLSDFLKRAVGNQLRERTTSTVEEVYVRDALGVQQVFKLDYSRLQDAKQKSLGTLLLFHNITELKALYNTMEKTAMTDMITGLASKGMLEKKITEINLYRKFPYCAVVCNINGLNLIATGFGEKAEAAANMHVADVLRSHLRATDFAAYADGNMIVLMSDTSAADAQLVFSRISDLISKDKTFNFQLLFEFGIAEKLSRDSDIQLTIAQAQALMLKKKLISHSYAEESIVESLEKALHKSSFETEQHSRRVRDLCIKIAEKLQLPESQYDELKLLALFHDIGKLSISQELLSKPEPLSEEESQIMMMHTINGSRVAQSSKELAPIARGILCHHEHWDGSGYPNGFAGEEIPFHARIVAVADAYDVMTHDRPWMQAMSSEIAIERIQAQSGKQFDPAVVKAFLQISFEKSVP